MIRILRMTTETTTKQKKISIDATGKRLGRLASEIAEILSGKHEPTFVPNAVPNVSVTVLNASGMQITEEKKTKKMYDRYTGYFGGRKETSLRQVLEKKGYAEALRRAVYGMLPSNRLRSVKMKRLRISE